MKWQTLLILLAALFLAACGGQTAAQTAVQDEIDLATLAPSVDAETVFALKDEPSVFLLDVREQWEYNEGHIPGITLIPMGEIAARMNEIPTDKTVIVTCRSGNRSSQITDFLRQQGFDNVHNMEGGILAWEEAGFPVE